MPLDSGVPIGELEMAFPDWSGVVITAPLALSGFDVLEVLPAVATCFDALAPAEDCETTGGVETAGAVFASAEDAPLTGPLGFCGWAVIGAERGVVVVVVPAVFPVGDDTLLADPVVVDLVLATGGITFAALPLGGVVFAVVAAGGVATFAVLGFAVGDAGAGVATFAGVGFAAGGAGAGVGATVFFWAGAGVVVVGRVAAHVMIGPSMQIPMTSPCLSTRFFIAPSYAILTLTTPWITLSYTRGRVCSTTWCLTRVLEEAHRALGPASGASP
jgi:hypothetical protein